MLYGQIAPHAAGSRSDPLGRGFRLRKGTRRAKRRHARCGSDPARGGQAQNQNRRARCSALRRTDGTHHRRSVFTGGSAHRKGRPRRAPPHDRYDARPAAPRLLLRPAALQPRAEAAQRSTARRGDAARDGGYAGYVGHGTRQGGRRTDAPSPRLHRKAVRRRRKHLSGNCRRARTAAGSICAQHHRGR